MQQQINPRQYITPKTWELTAAGSRLPSAQREIVLSAIQRHRERADRRAADAVPAKTLAERYESRIRRQVKAAVLRHYRTAAGTWAGGRTTVTVTVVRRGEALVASGQSTTAWSTNGKWSGRDAEIAITVGRDWLGIPEHLRVAGGMLTLRAAEVAPSTWAASWLVQKRGFDVSICDGYIHQNPDGTHSHAVTQRAAETMWHAAQRRLANQAASAARLDQLRSMTASELAERFGALVVEARDSLRAGNCATGTRSWIETRANGRQQGTISELLAIEDSRYTRIAACAAILRHRAA